MIDVHSPQKIQIAIFDKTNNNKIIAAGKLSNVKNIPVDCISIDNKFYFLTKENDFYSIKEMDEEEFDVPFDPMSTSIPVKLWREVYKDINCVCVYRDFTIDEADPEVLEIIHTLNKIDNIRTTSSCSGHYTSRAYIDIAFKGFDSLFKIVKLLDLNEFRNDFQLATSDTIANNSQDEIILKLTTKNYGEPAYHKINELNEKLKELFL